MKYIGASCIDKLGAVSWALGKLPRVWGLDTINFVIVVFTIPLKLNESFESFLCTKNHS